MSAHVPATMLVSEVQLDALDRRIDAHERARMSATLGVWSYAAAYIGGIEGARPLTGAALAAYVPADTRRTIEGILNYRLEALSALLAFMGRTNARTGDPPVYGSGDAPWGADLFGDRPGGGGVHHTLPRNWPIDYVRAFLVPFRKGAESRARGSVHELLLHVPLISRVFGDAHPSTTAYEHTADALAETALRVVRMKVPPGDLDDDILDVVSRPVRTDANAEVPDGADIVGAFAPILYLYTHVGAGIVRGLLAPARDGMIRDAVGRLVDNDPPEGEDADDVVRAAIVVARSLARYVVATSADLGYTKVDNKTLSVVLHMRTLTFPHESVMRVFSRPDGALVFTHPLPSVLCAGGISTYREACSLLPAPLYSGGPPVRVHLFVDNAPGTEELDANTYTAAYTVDAFTPSDHAAGAAAASAPVVHTRALANDTTMRVQPGTSIAWGNEYTSSFEAPAYALLLDGVRDVRNAAMWAPRVGMRDYPVVLEASVQLVRQGARGGPTALVMRFVAPDDPALHAPARGHDGRDEGVSLGSLIAPTRDDASLDTFYHHAWGAPADASKWVSLYRGVVTAAHAGGLAGVGQAIRALAATSRAHERSYVDVAAYTRLFSVTGVASGAASYVEWVKRAGVSPSAWSAVRLDEPAGGTPGDLVVALEYMEQASHEAAQTGARYPYNVLGHGIVAACAAFVAHMGIKHTDDTVREMSILRARHERAGSAATLEDRIGAEYARTVARQTDDANGLRAQGAAVRAFLAHAKGRLAAAQVHAIGAPDRVGDWGALARAVDAYTVPVPPRTMRASGAHMHPSFILRGFKLVRASEGFELSMRMHDLFVPDDLRNGVFISAPTSTRRAADGHTLALWFTAYARAIDTAGLLTVDQPGQGALHTLKSIVSAMLRVGSGADTSTPVGHVYVHDLNAYNKPVWVVSSRVREAVDRVGTYARARPRRQLPEGAAAAADDDYYEQLEDEIAYVLDRVLPSAQAASHTDQRACVWATRLLLQCALRTLQLGELGGWDVLVPRRQQQHGPYKEAAGGQLACNATITRLAIEYTAGALFVQDYEADNVPIKGIISVGEWLHASPCSYMARNQALGPTVHTFTQTTWDASHANLTVADYARAMRATLVTMVCADHEAKLTVLSAGAHLPPVRGGGDACPRDGVYVQKQAMYAYTDVYNQYLTQACLLLRAVALDDDVLLVPVHWDVIEGAVEQYTEEDADLRFVHAVGVPMNDWTDAHVHDLITSLFPDAYANLAREHYVREPEQQFTRQLELHAEEGAPLSSLGETTGYISGRTSEFHSAPQEPADPGSVTARQAAAAADAAAADAAVAADEQREREQLRRKREVRAQRELDAAVQRRREEEERQTAQRAAELARQEELMRVPPGVPPSVIEPPEPAARPPGAMQLRARAPPTVPAAGLSVLGRGTRAASAAPSATAAAAAATAAARPAGPPPEGGVPAEPTEVHSTPPSAGSLELSVSPIGAGTAVATDPLLLIAGAIGNAYALPALRLFRPSSEPDGRFNMPNWSREVARKFQRNLDQEVPDSNATRGIVEGILHGRAPERQLLQQTLFEIADGFTTTLWTAYYGSADSAKMPTDREAIQTITDMGIEHYGATILCVATIALQSAVEPGALAGHTTGACSTPLAVAAYLISVIYLLYNKITMRTEVAGRRAVVHVGGMLVRIAKTTIGSLGVAEREAAAGSA